MSCPNGNKNFNEMLKKLLGHDPTPSDRKKIYYFICIVIRLCLLLILYKYRSHTTIQYAALILSIFGIYHLSMSIKNDPDTQWWSRKFQLIMACLIALAAILAIVGKIDPIYLSILFGISLSGGFLQSLFITFC